MQYDVTIILTTEEMKRAIATFALENIGIGVPFSDKDATVSIADNGGGAFRATVHLSVVTPK